MIELFAWLISARGRLSRQIERKTNIALCRETDTWLVKNSLNCWSKHNKRIIKFKLQRRVSWRLNAKRTWRNLRRGKWKLRTWPGTLPSYWSESQEIVIDLCALYIFSYIRYFYISSPFLSLSTELFFKYEFSPLKVWWKLYDYLIMEVNRHFCP